jgi:hypothetical protein
MPQPESGPADRTPDVHLLFAHEPYWVFELGGVRR